MINIYSTKKFKANKYKIFGGIMTILTITGVDILKY